MGVQKNWLTPLNNKKRYAKVKFYKFYRKDFWGYLRLKRLYSYKKIVYNILKTKKKFHKIILNQVFQGIKFFVKKLTYKGNLFIVKKRIQYFYYKLTDKQIGNLVKKFIRTKFNVVNKFFSILECRLDVFLVRALYFITVRDSNRVISNSKSIFVNNKCICIPNYIIKVADIITLFVRPVANPFFLTFNYNSVDIEKLFLKKLKIQKQLYFKIFCLYYYFFFRKRSKNKFFKKIKSFISFLKFFRKLKLSKKIHILKLFNFFLIKKNLNYNVFLQFYLKYIILLYRFCIFLKNKLRRIYKYKYLVIKQFCFIYKTYKNFFIFNNKFKYSKYFKIFFNLPNLIARLNYFRSFFKIKKKFFYGFFFNRMKYFYNSKVSIKKFRFFKISKLLYKRLKLKKMFLYSGYPPYMEINFKLHTIIMVKEPMVSMVKYPFFVNNLLFFNYFKLQSYF